MNRFVCHSKAKVLEMPFSLFLEMRRGFTERCLQIQGRDQIRLGAG